MNKKIDKIFEILKKMYPEPKTELNYSTPFQLMVAVILSAQATDKQVNKVTKGLFEIIKNPEDVVCYSPSPSKIEGDAKESFKAFEKAISSINYYKTKAKNIWELASQIPPNPPFLKGGQHSVEWLKTLPGIGEKSAKVIGHVLWNLPVIAVDTHVQRVVNRWGIVHTKKPKETSKNLEKIVPKKYKHFAHHAIVLFGRYVCTAKKPKCAICKLQKFCDYKSLLF